MSATHSLKGRWCHPSCQNCALTANADAMLCSWVYNINIWLKLGSGQAAAYTILCYNICSARVPRTEHTIVDRLCVHNGTHLTTSYITIGNCTSYSIVKMSLLKAALFTCLLASVSAYPNLLAGCAHPTTMRGSHAAPQSDT